MFKQSRPKKLFLLTNLWFLLFFIVSISFAGLFNQTGKNRVEAATSSTINFQARLLTSTGALVPDGFYNVKFNLYTASSGGSTQWTEEYYDSNGVTAGNDNRVRVVNGYLSVYLGSQTAFPSTINWDQEQWLTLNIGGTAQTATPTYDGEMSPRLKLSAVPYALTSGSLQKTSGSNELKVNLATPTADVNYTFQDAAAGSYDVCTTATVCTGYAASSGSGSYIQNGTSTQTNANFNIQSAASGSVGGVIQGASGQTADLFQLKTSTPFTVLSVGATGATLFKNSSDSATAFQIQSSSSSTSVFNVDTTNKRLGINTNAPTATLDLQGLQPTGSGNTAADTVLNVSGGKGQDRTTTGVAGNGGAISITSGGGGDNTSGTSGGNGGVGGSLTIGGGTGGHPTAGTQGNGGAGGSITIQGGTGGGSLNTFTGGSGGSVSIQGGAGGSGGDTNGNRGAITIQTTGGNITLGNTALTSASTLQAGTGGLSITTQGTGALAIGNNAVAQTINIGNVTGATSLTQRVGTGNYSLDGVAGSTYTFGASTTTGTISIGGTAQTGSITLGSSSGTASVLIGNGTGASTVSIGNATTAGSTVNIAGAATATGNTDTINIATGNTAGTGAKTVHIADGTPAGTGSNTVSIGSSANASAVTLTAGTGNINLQAGTIVGNATTQNLFNTVATTINFGGGATTALNIGPTGATATSINLAGGGSDTGCTVAGATGNFTCSGNLLSGSNQAFVQNGNSMGATAVLGTNDSNSLAFETGGTTKWLINTTGDLLPNANDTYNIGSDTARVANLYLGGETLHIGSSTSDEGTISYNNTTDSLLFKNATSSTTAFQIQNASSGSLLNVDSTNSNISLLGNNTGEIQTWQSTSTLGANMIAKSVVMNGYIYAITDSNTTSNNYYAKLNNNGSVDTWTATTTAPNDTDAPSVVAAGGYIYHIGGRDSSSGTVLTTAYSAKQYPDGSLGDWVNLTNTPLPAARWDAGATVANGYIYIVGGYNSGSQDDVYYAKYNPDGTLGSWTTQSAVLPGNQAGSGVAAANGYIYSVGGYGTAPRAQTYRAALNVGDGSTGTWSATTSIPTATDNPRVVIQNGYIYAISGDTSSTFWSGSNTVNTVFYAKLNTDGSLNSWSTSTHTLPSTNVTPGVVSANGYIYLVGGYNGAAYLNTVYYNSGTRLQIGGSLDLVGLEGGNLNDSGGGGSLTAGNTNLVGSLQVQGQASFASSVNINGPLSTGGNISANDNYLQHTFVDGSTGNLVYNGNLETGTEGWSTSLASVYNQGGGYYGGFSMGVIYSGSGDNYIYQNLPDIPQTLANRSYTLSFWAKADSNVSLTNGEIYLQENSNGFDTACDIGFIDITTSWKHFQVSCTWGPEGDATTWRVILRSTGNVSNDIYYDGVMVNNGTSATAFNPLYVDDSGTISTYSYDSFLQLNSADDRMSGINLRESDGDWGFNLLYDGTGTNEFILQADDGGTVRNVFKVQRSDGSVIFQNSADSTTAFQIQDETGYRIFNVDTSDSFVDIRRETQAGSNVGLSFTTSNGTDWLFVSGSGSSDFELWNDNLNNDVALFHANGNIALASGVTGATLTADIAGTGTTRAICHSGTAAQTNDVQFVDCTGTPAADYAENYPVSSDADYGDTVSTGTNMVNTYDVNSDGDIDWTKVKGQVTQLVKSGTPYQTNTIGIVSENDGDFSSVGYNIKPEDNPMPIALNGRVPVNISSDSEPIQPGDYITTSPDSGKAMKATHAGFVIAKALESWTPGSGKTQVMVFVEQGYWPGLSPSDYVQNGGNATISDLVVTGVATLSNLNVAGNANVGGNLNVTGDSQVTGDANVGQNLTVSGDSTLQGNLTVSGSADFQGSINTDQDLNVMGKTGLNNDLTVTGKTDLQGDLKVSGNSQLQQVTASSIDLTGNAVVNELTANVATLSQITASDATITNLSVNGTATISTLHITGDSVFNGLLTINSHIITGKLDSQTHLDTEVLDAAGKDTNGDKDGICEIDGNDTSGVITLTTGTQDITEGTMCKITFIQPFTSVPRTIISALDKDSLQIGGFTLSTNNDFTLNLVNTPDAHNVYKFNYWNPQ